MDGLVTGGLAVTEEVGLPGDDDEPDGLPEPDGSAEVEEPVPEPGPDGVELLDVALEPGTLPELLWVPRLEWPEVSGPEAD